MQEYYNRRASEYEAIYYATTDPTRQAELAVIEKKIESLVAGRRVLEIACGTGYWTRIAARVARHVTAVDASAEMLEIARNKNLPSDRVTLLSGDAYNLTEIPGVFDAALANFWFSHVLRSRIADFLVGVQSKLRPGSTVIMADNVYMPGVGGELVRPAESEDTFKLRTLSDGSQHLILKNYFDEEQLRAILSPFASQLEVHVGAAYWWCGYLTP